MRHTSIAIIAILLIVCLCPMFTHAQRVAAGVPRPEALYVFGKPKAIVASDASTASWSPNGRYALVATDSGPDDPGVPHSISIYAHNIATGRTVPMWRSNSVGSGIVTISWFEGTDKAIAFIEPAGRVKSSDALSSRPLWVCLDARKGVTTETPGIDSMTEFDPSPVLPLAIAAVEIDSGMDLFAIRPDGTFTRSMHMRNEPTDTPAGTYDNTWWTADGKTFCIDFTKVYRSGDIRHSTHTWKTWNPVTGIVATVASAPDEWKRPRPTSTIAISCEPAYVTNGPGKARIVPVWAEQGTGRNTRRYLVSPDSDWVEVSPAGNGILVLANGIATITPMRKVSGAERETIVASERVEATNRAKKVGLALRMYQDDYDGALPPQGRGIAAAIDPFIRSYKDLVSPGTGQDFVFTIDNARRSSSELEKTTMLGYLPGPGGRAIVYADGHSAWVPD